ncbi:MAG: thioredoxin domain-containing protein [Bacteroidia bacterium]|nr:thioredoxin domain-containing protein [Bacteroidia bacterium]
MRKLIIFLNIVFIAVSARSQTVNQEKQSVTGVPVYLTTAEFKEKVFDYEKNKDWKYEGKLPAIVDFYADWCRPCKMMAPIMDSIQENFNGKLIIYKVNVDNEKELAGTFRIEGIPAFLLIPLNEPPQMTSGYRIQKDFIKIINEVLKVQ